MAMTRFFRRGVSKIRWSATVPANKSAPTRAELNASINLSEAVAEISGFQLNNSPIPTPNLEDSFTPQIDGEDTVADSGLTLYDDQASAATRNALAKGSAGALFLLPYGDVAAKRMEVWPAKSTGVNDEWSMGNDPARVGVGFAITAVPVQNAVVPAAV